jgi:hypothetical protein
MKELCKTYFEFDGKVINGYKVVEECGSYDIYVYTSCKKLGNWQLFLSYKNIDKVIRYFENQVKRDIEESKEYYDQFTIDWISKENKWRKDTLEQLQNNISKC